MLLVPFFHRSNNHMFLQANQETPLSVAYTISTKGPLSSILNHLIQTNHEADIQTLFSNQSNNVS